ncbi:MAG: diguanylate cyclase [Coriobacteriia bacterium]|nr:diguanylate cyclase [Coriobacteriia bacterium]
MDADAVVRLSLYLAAILQIIAAVLALYLIPLSGKRASWIVLCVALILQAWRRIHAVGDNADVVEALTAFVVSVLLVIGVIGIRAVFVSLKNTRLELLEERRRSGSFLDHVGAAIVVLDTGGTVVEANDEARALLSNSGGDIAGRNWFESFVAENIRDGVRRGYEYLLESPEGDDEYMEYTVTTAEGSQCAVVWHLRVLRDEAGRCVGIRSAGIDVSDSKRLDEELEFYSVLLDHADDAVLAYRMDGTIIYANAAACSCRGKGRGDLVGESVRSLIPQEDLETFAVHLQSVQDGSSAVFETDGTRADGTPAPLESRLARVSLGDRNLVVDVARDVTERRESEAAVRRLAFSDTLTGLANWPALCDRAALTFARAQGRGECEAVIYVDVDELKSINESGGREAGDEALRFVAARLVTLFRSEDTVARVGGAEFVVLARVRDVGELRELVRRARRLLADKVFFRNQRISLTVSVGAALFPADGEDIETLVARADESARSKGPNGMDSNDLGIVKGTRG